MSAMGRMIHLLCLVTSITGGMALQAPALADSVPFWGAKASVPIDTPINQWRAQRVVATSSTLIDI